MIEGEFVFRAAILTFEAVAQKHVEACKGGMPAWPDVGFQRDNARQLHLEGRAVNGEVIVRDDIYPIKEDRLDRILPRPQRKRIITQRSVISI